MLGDSRKGTNSFHELGVDEVITVTHNFMRDPKDGNNMMQEKAGKLFSCETIFSTRDTNDKASQSTDNDQDVVVGEAIGIGNKGKLNKIQAEVGEDVFRNGGII